MMTSKFVIVPILLAIGTLSSVAGAEPLQYECDATEKNFTVGIEYANLQGIRSIPLTVVGVNTKAPSSCTWTIAAQSVGAAFPLLLKKLTLGSTDKLVIFGLDDKGNKTVLFQGTDVGNSGFVDILSFAKIEVFLEFSKDVPSVPRSFDAVYTWSLPSFLSLESDVLTLFINQNNVTPPARNLNFATQRDGSAFMVTFLALPHTYDLTINTVSYSNAKNALPKQLYLANSSMNIQLNSYNPLNNPITLRYWTVTKQCSGDVDMTKSHEYQIQYVNEAQRKAGKLTQAKCAQLVKGPADKQLRVEMDLGLTQLYNPEDSITFFNENGTIELDLNFGSIQYFKNVDTFLSNHNYLVVYRSPYFSEHPNEKFVAPKLRVSDNGGFYMVPKDKPLEVTVGDGKTIMDDVHIVYGTDFMINTVQQMNLEFVNPPATVQPGNWSITVYPNEQKPATPLIVLGDFDVLPSVVPNSGASFMRVLFKGPVPKLTLRYRIVDTASSCNYIASGNMNFDIRTNQSSSNCTWLLPQSNKNFTILNPISVQIPAGRTLYFRRFLPKGSTIETFNGPIESSFLPDIFLKGNAAYEISLNPTVPLNEKVHVMFAQRNEYLNLNSTVQIDSKNVSTIESVNYPGKYPYGFSQGILIAGNGRALLTIEDMDLAQDHSFSYFSQETDSTKLVPNDLTKFADQIVTMPVLFTFDSQKFELKNLLSSNISPAPRGFKASVMRASIAEKIDVAKTSTFKFESRNSSFSNMIAVWTLKYDDKSGNNSDSILRINVTFSQDVKQMKQALTVYDSLSIRAPNAHQASSSMNSSQNFFLTSTRSAIIVYNYTMFRPLTSDYSVSFSVGFEKCHNTKNYTLTKCQNVDRCINDLMICNGVDDCGDFSDEMYCKFGPLPPAPNVSGGGVSVLTAIFLLMPLGAILGIFGYVYLPQLLLRLRNGRYSEFRDLSSVS